MIGINYLTFSDAAKYADLARNILSGSYTTSFNFWDGNNALSIQPFMAYSISVLYKIFGINDLAVILTSFIYYIFTLLFGFLLAQKIFGNKIVSYLSTISIGFNYNYLLYATSGASEMLFTFETLASAYFLTHKKWWGNMLGILFMFLMYFTRPQAIVYIFGLFLYYFILNFQWKKGLIYAIVTFCIGTFFYFIFSKQGLIAVTQNLPGTAVSDSLRGMTVESSPIELFKKVFYNLYNFYKAIPQIMNPYLFALSILGLFSWGKDKLLNSFKITSLFMVLATFFVTALTIPFYRYIHPVIPFIYIIGVITLYEIINNQQPIIKQIPNFKFQILNKYRTAILTTLLALFFAVGQTLGIIFLDSRFERKTKNVDKPPVYVLMSWKLKVVTDKDQIIVTNLDTWGSWYGERKTVWFPLEPDMILPVQDNIDAIYLTSYKMDDENYYMGQRWREIFENPETQSILPDYKFVGQYEFKAEDNYERENGRAILLVRN